MGLGPALPASRLRLSPVSTPLLLARSMAAGAPPWRVAASWQRTKKKACNAGSTVYDFRDCLENGVQLILGVYDLIGQTLVVDLIGAIIDLLLELSNPVMIHTV